MHVHTCMSYSWSLSNLAPTFFWVKPWEDPTDLPLPCAEDGRGRGVGCLDLQAVCISVSLWGFLGRKHGLALEILISPVHLTYVCVVLKKLWVRRIGSADKSTGYSSRGRGFHSPAPTWQLKAQAGSKHVHVHTPTHTTSTHTNKNVHAHR